MCEYVKVLERYEKILMKILQNTLLTHTAKQQNKILTLETKYSISTHVIVPPYLGMLSFV